jgi:hypothetical protein
MKKLIGLLLVVSVITACATTKSKTADVTIDQHQYSIYAKYMPGFFTDQIMVYVNDQEIGKGTISQFHLTTDISGTSSDGTKFDADCGISMSSLLRILCIVSVKGQKVAELPF